MPPLSLLLALVAQLQFAALPPAPPERSFAPEDLEQLLPMLGQEISLVGTAARVAENKAHTVSILNFSRRADQGVALIFTAGKSEPTFTRARLQSLVGKPILVHGTLVNHCGRLQMEVASEEQVHDLSRSATKQALAAVAPAAR